LIFKPIRDRSSQIGRQYADYVRIKNGRVGERLKPAVLKNKIAVSLSSRKFQFASRKIAKVLFDLPIFSGFAPLLVTICWQLEQEDKKVTQTMT